MVATSSTMRGDAAVAGERADTDRRNIVDPHHPAIASDHRHPFHVDETLDRANRSDDLRLLTGRDAATPLLRSRRMMALRRSPTE